MGRCVHEADEKWGGESKGAVLKWGGESVTPFRGARRTAPKGSPPQFRVRLGLG